MSIGSRSPDNHLLRRDVLPLPCGVWCSEAQTDVVNQS